MAAIAIAPIQMQIITAINHFLRTKKTLLFIKPFSACQFASDTNIICHGKRKYQECYRADFLNFSRVFVISRET